MKHDFNLSDSHTRRLKKEWERVSKESLLLEVTTLNSDKRAFGSEIACLRLLQYYKCSPRCKVEFSQNLNMFCFTLLAC